MAGEAGHVVYAGRLLTHLKNKVESPAYWVGTLFPDIRHLGVASRHRTHPASVSLHSLVGETDFATGMRVHAWVDATREKFLHDAHMKELLPWHPFVPHALKLVEDELLYGAFEDWDLIQRVLQRGSDEEEVFVDDREALIRWHRVLQTYLAQPPTDDTRYQLSLDIGLSKNSAIEINSVVKRLKEHTVTEKLLEEFWQHLESLLA
jgi:hypothetical protein